MGGGRTGTGVGHWRGRRQRRAAAAAPHPQPRQSEAWRAPGAGSQWPACLSGTCKYVGSTLITVKPLSRLIAKACQAPRSPRLHTGRQTVSGGREHGWLSAPAGNASLAGPTFHCNCWHILSSTTASSGARSLGIDNRALDRLTPPRKSITIPYILQAQRFGFRGAHYSPGPALPAPWDTDRGSQGAGARAHAWRE
jgi:hypothetical protein